MNRKHARVLAIAVCFTVLLSATAAAAPAEEEAGFPFADVTEGSWYYDSVVWGCGCGMVCGVDSTHLAPERVCTRAEAVTMLWRLVGSPEPSSLDTPFTDIVHGSYYEQAAVWACLSGVTCGTSANSFSPQTKLTRDQFITLLWRYVGSPQASCPAPFTDVDTDSFCAAAVAWAYERGVAAGVGSSAFAPSAGCTRAEVITFIFREMSPA